jgi:DNA invertase Pin-like site-specific DNA recombinase
LSKDDGSKTSTERQVRECRAYAKGRGWSVARVFVDRDLSGFTGVDRPEYEAMRSALSAGEADGVLAFKLDRLGRRVHHVAALIAEADERGAFVAGVAHHAEKSLRRRSS